MKRPITTPTTYTPAVYYESEMNYRIATGEIAFVNGRWCMPKNPTMNYWFTVHPDEYRGNYDPKYWQMLTDDLHLVRLVDARYY
jgi:hypothetical protein